MKGTVMCVKDQVIVNLHDDRYQECLNEFETDFGPNNLIFNFPDDDHYNDVEVTVLTTEELVTYTAVVNVIGSFPAQVKARSKREALEMFHNGDYEGDDGFSLNDCETTHYEIAYDDIEDDDDYVYERGVTK
jgi:hypothetical protein